MWRKTMVGVLILVLVLIVYLLLWPIPYEPIAWNPPNPPELTGTLAPNKKLAGASRMLAGIGKGPEDIAFDEKGNLYSGFEGGRIVTMPVDGSGYKVFANTNGRPLGMVFDKSGNLIVADAYKGLVSVAPNSEVTILATEAGGIPINFPDDLDIGPDGNIYFSDASIEFGYGKDFFDLLLHRGKGRLICYNPSTGKANVLLDGLQFANGVTVARDGSYLLVSESGAYCIRRLWLNGLRKGEWEIFKENLPGFPDNINMTDRGTVLVALPVLRLIQFDYAASRPFLRKIFYRIMLALSLFPSSGAPPNRYGLVVELDGNGKIIGSFHDPDGKVAYVTSAMERQGVLYLGSHLETSVAVVSLNN